MKGVERWSDDSSAGPAIGSDNGFALMMGCTDQFATPPCAVGYSETHVKPSFKERFLQNLWLLWFKASLQILKPFEPRGLGFAALQLLCTEGSITVVVGL